MGFDLCLLIWQNTESKQTKKKTTTTSKHDIEKAVPEVRRLLSL